MPITILERLVSGRVIDIRRGLSLWLPVIPECYDLVSPSPSKLNEGVVGGIKTRVEIPAHVVTWSQRPKYQEEDDDEVYDGPQSSRHKVSLELVKVQVRVSQMGKGAGELTSRCSRLSAGKLSHWKESS